MPVKHAAIAGAGIAGLTAALALARHGIGSEIFEQASALAEVGAGLQLSPNASRILRQLGVLGEIEKCWLEPEMIRLVAGDTHRPLAAVPAGRFARDRWDAPYGVLHRATLQRVLLDAVRSNPLCRLHLGTPFESASLPSGIAIGADGVWSKMRQDIPGAPSARFSGNIAYRFTISQAEAPDFLDRGNVAAYLGPAAHLVCYPLKETASFNLVAITTGTDDRHLWDGGAERHQLEILQSRFKGWNLGIRSLFGDIAPTFWPLYEATDGRWQNGRDRVLIGDAAHAMMPFAAQGAAMAIEDAFELGEMLSREEAEQALPRFEALRTSRIAKIRKRGAFNRFAYHARGPIRIGRDIVLSLKPPQSLAADLDWIYGYRPQA